ncbi:bacterioferritin comigratory protein [Legionella birminghamensis]|uniref:thioredoxin-dependent peroxiredoxin n=1 Tax=Legionella birminghamensis TaxID=28083 RepID=A0A378I6J3_9GAMM|nr:peroxiredoxin [Legionella birminghamensis]KTC70226.1 bacterioferritin comigratory protein [Legionella birminghamensis]STX30366.1 bacterioferritin comigratory protein [Legionella birminghamensis]
MKIGETVQDFQFVATNDLAQKLSDYRGKWLVLYFYPKDSTPGCTLESQNFRDNYSKFKHLNTEILGISRDSLSSHDKFKCKQELPFELISDQNEAICNQFDVIKMKMMYGKQVRGIERSTFLIDPEGVLRKEWRKVSVDNHVKEILEAIKAFQA